MSYINQALRKAQEAKDSPYTPYRQFIETGAGQGGQVRRKGFCWFGGAAALLLLFAILLFAGGRAPFVADKTSPAAAPGEGVVTAPAMPPPEASPELNALFEQAITAQRLQRFAEAEQIYGKILARMPNHKKSLNNLGVLFLERGDYAQARQFLERAQAADVSWAEPHYNLACLMGRQGRQEEGLVHLQQAAALSPAALDWAATDDDLRSIRLLPEYIKMMKR